MLRFHPSRFGWLLVLTLGLWAVAVQAQDYRYRYVSFEGVDLPSGFLSFGAGAIDNSGRVYGSVLKCPTPTCDSLLLHVAVYEHGTVTVRQPGLTYAANEGGTIGGSVLIDAENFIEQAALFHGDQTELIRPQPGEFTSWVFALNDSGMALVNSFDADGQPTYVLYQNGQTTVLDFGLPVGQSVSFLDINNHGIISGTANFPGIGVRGFRFDTRTGKTTRLDPLSTEPDSWALGINNRGDVLGYSFIGGGIERIGVWDRHSNFQTYFVEGTPEFPTLSNRLRFNDNNLIVITFTSQRFGNNSYLVPRPGVRLNLADLVEHLPPLEGPLWNITDVNNHGDIIGFGITGNSFLLKRIGGPRPPL
jgi:hypothetical protein